MWWPAWLRSPWGLRWPGWGGPAGPARPGPGLAVIVLVGVALAGAVGAPARYLADSWVARRSHGPFPWGTFAINVVGSFVLGLLAGLALWRGLSTDVETVLGTGLCGAFTTFSTFAYETVRLVEQGELVKAGLNAAGSLVVGLLAGAAGLALAALV